jgi:DNA mismatch endonuclease (patch repair protein)
MRSVKSSNTKPELLLRRRLWAIGMRGWRINRTDLPGKPDIVFGPARVAVFVDGAFWHGHPTKYWPGRCGPYWDKKIQRNMRRDREVEQRLSDDGWSVIRAWDFDIEKDLASVARRVQKTVTKRSQK